MPSVYSKYSSIKGTFQKAIMQSGCMFNSWALNEKHKEIAFMLARSVGCQKDDPQEIVQYLKNIPAKDLVKCTKFEVSSVSSN